MRRISSSLGVTIIATDTFRLSPRLCVSTDDSAREFIVGRASASSFAGAAMVLSGLAAAAAASAASVVVVVVVVVVQARARHRPRGGGGGVILFLVRAHLLLVLSPRLRAHVEDGRARVRAALQRRGLFLLPHHAHETSYDLPRGDGVLDLVDLGHLPHHRGRGFS
jgi:hypothetical protein